MMLLLLALDNPLWAKIVFLNLFSFSEMLLYLQNHAIST